jgi:GNAT superfamily N-acetyltransferase
LMHIRQARTEDAAAACAVVRRSIAELCRADHGWDEVLLARWLSNKTVENLTQWPDARFRGVSKALVQQLEEAASSLGLSECVLETTQTALPFYQSLGYVKSGETYPLSLTGSPATVLRKNLKTS